MSHLLFAGIGMMLCVSFLLAFWPIGQSSANTRHWTSSLVLTEPGRAAERRPSGTLCKPRSQLVAKLEQTSPVPCRTRS